MSKPWSPDRILRIFQKFGLNTTLKRVRFGGIVGKLVLFGIVALAVLGVIASRLDPGNLLWLALIVVLVVLAIGGAVLVFGMKFPELATLEGTEVVLLKQQSLFGTEQKQLDDSALEALEKTANPMEVKSANSSEN